MKQIIIQENIADLEELNWTEKVIFAYLKQNSHKNIVKLPNIEIANILHVSESKVSETISKLIKLNIIKLNKFDGRIRWLELLK